MQFDDENEDELDDSDDDIDEETEELMANYDIDQDQAEYVKDIMNEYGFWMKMKRWS